MQQHTAPNENGHPGRGDREKHTANKSIPTGWSVVEYTPVNRKALIATCVLEMPSGRTDYTDIVSWATPERRKAWSEAALATVRPHLQAPPAREEAGDGYTPF